MATDLCSAHTVARVVVVIGVRLVSLPSTSSSSPSDEAWSDRAVQALVSNPLNSHAFTCATSKSVGVVGATQHSVTNASRHSVSSLTAAARDAHLLQDPGHALSLGSAPHLSVEHNLSRIALAFLGAGQLSAPSVLAALAAQSVHADQLADATAVATHHREELHAPHTVVTPSRLGPFLGGATCMEGRGRLLIQSKDG